MIAALRGDMPALKQWSDLTTTAGWFLKGLYLKMMGDDAGLEAWLTTSAVENEAARFYVSALREDVAETIDALKHALDAGFALAHRFVHPLPIEAELFVKVYADQRYQDLLRQYGLDKDSLAKIKFPALKLDA